MPAVPADFRSWLPLDYARFFHRQRDSVGGVVRFCHHVPSRRPDEKTGKHFPVLATDHYSPASLARETCPLHDRGHRYMTVARFEYPKPGKSAVPCTEATVTGLVANVLDLDVYRPELGWQGVEISDILDAILNHIQDLKLPEPTLINFTGRGFLVVWHYPCQPRAILPRHRMVQETLHEAFEAFGSDASALSPTKWFRMPATLNPKSGEAVRVAWPERPSMMERSTFDTLHGAVVRLRARQTAEKAARRPVQPPRAPRERTGRAPKTKLLPGGYYEAVKADIARLFAFRYPDGVMPSVDGAGRNHMGLAETIVEAHLRPAGRALDAFVRENAARWGLSEGEALSATSKVRSNALRAAKGETVNYKGQQVTPRYRVGVDVLRKWLRVTDIAEMRAAGLRVIVDEERRAELSKERVEKSRRARGVKANADRLADRLAYGREALRLRDEGLTNAQILGRLGRSQGYLAMALREAKDAPALPAPAPKPAPAPSRRDEIMATMDAYFAARRREAIEDDPEPEEDAPRYTVTHVARVVDDARERLDALVVPGASAYSVGLSGRNGTSLSSDEAAPAQASAARALFVERMRKAPAFLRELLE